MANYTKQEQRKLEVAEHAARLRNERYTLFHNDYDPHFRVVGVTAERAVRQLEEWTGAQVFLYRAGDRWGYGVKTPVVHKLLGQSDGGTIKYSTRSTAGDAAAARIELGHHIVLAGIGCFRGLPNLTFEANLKKLRAFVSLPPMAPADEYNAAKRQLLPRDLMNLELYGTRMRDNLLRTW